MDVVQLLDLAARHGFACLLVERRLNKCRAGILTGVDQPDTTGIPRNRNKFRYIYNSKVRIMAELAGKEGRAAGLPMLEIVRYGYNLGPFACSLTAA